MNIFSYKLSGLAFAALLAGSAAGIGSPAQAAPASSAQAATATIQYADLNLASDAGIRRLQARIRTAAERLCIEPGTVSVQQQAVGKACIEATVAAAQPQVRLAIARTAEQQFADAAIDKTGY